jgi:DNA polymerase III epsilon subunit-like protein
MNKIPRTHLSWVLGQVMLDEKLKKYVFSAFSTINKWKNKKCQVIFYDLETSGYNDEHHEILQTSAKSGDSNFNVFIRPSEPISIQATQIHCLSSANEIMYQNYLPIVSAKDIQI